MLHDVYTSIYATMLVCVDIQAGCAYPSTCEQNTIRTTTVTEWAWQEKFIAKMMAKRKRKASLYINFSRKG